MVHLGCLAEDFSSSLELFSSQQDTWPSSNVSRGSRSPSPPPSFPRGAQRPASLISQHAILCASGAYFNELKQYSLELDSSTGVSDVLATSSRFLASKIKQLLTFDAPSFGRVVCVRHENRISILGANNATSRSEIFNIEKHLSLLRHVDSDLPLVNMAASSWAEPEVLFTNSSPPLVSSSSSYPLLHSWLPSRGVTSFQVAIPRIEEHPFVHCLYGTHPRDVWLWGGESIFRHDLRDGSTRLLTQVSSLAHKPTEERLFQVQMIEETGFLAAVSTSRSVLLLDARMPSHPILQWDHAIVEPLPLLAPLTLRDGIGALGVAGRSSALLYQYGCDPTVPENTSLFAHGSSDVFLNHEHCAVGGLAASALKRLESSWCGLAPIPLLKHSAACFALQNKSGDVFLRYVLPPTVPQNIDEAALRDSWERFNMAAIGIESAERQHEGVEVTRRNPKCFYVTMSLQNLSRKLLKTKVDLIQNDNDTRALVRRLASLAPRPASHSAEILTSLQPDSIEHAIVRTLATEGLVSISVLLDELDASFSVSDITETLLSMDFLGIALQKPQGNEDIYHPSQISVYLRGHVSRILDVVSQQPEPVVQRGLPSFVDKLKDAWPDARDELDRAARAALPRSLSTPSVRSSARPVLSSSSSQPLRREAAPILSTPRSKDHTRPVGSSQPLPFRSPDRPSQVASSPLIVAPAIRTSQPLKSQGTPKSSSQPASNSAKRKKGF